MSRFAESGPAEEPLAEAAPEVTAEQLQSLLSAAPMEGIVPSLTLEVTFAQWKQIWSAVGEKPPATLLRLTVNGTSVLAGCVFSQPGLTKPCQSGTS